MTIFLSTSLPLSFSLRSLPSSFPDHDHGWWVSQFSALFISGVSKVDEGTYVCQAKNQFGTDEISASLMVTGIISPVIAFISPLFQLTEAETFTLRCSVIIGNPRPEIE